MPEFKKAVVIGVGLIGGSLAAALKSKRLAAEVVGISRRQSTINTALAKGLIDKGSTDLSRAQGADIVIFATPPTAVSSLAREVSLYLGKDCLVIDVCSTKQGVVKQLSRLFKRYVGCHPLAGSERKGPESADPGIFKDCLCVITAGASANRASVNSVRRLWKLLGARVILMAADEHDRILAYVSHLPHIIAFLLMESVPKEYLKFAAGGFRDTTRIAASDSFLWMDIIRNNRDNVGVSLRSFERQLSKVKTALKKGDFLSLKRIFSAASSKRLCMDNPKGKK